MKKIGYIGVGTMGLPMVKHLIDSGYETYVLEGRGKAQEAIEYGAKVAKSPKNMALQVDCLMTCLPLPETVREVYAGDEGILEGLHRGLIVLDHSTVDQETNTYVSNLITEKGGEFLDAPVSGGPMGAEAGTLTIMCGGTEEAFEKVKPILSSYGEYIAHVGKVGSGTVVKLLNNMLIGVHQAALAECYVMAEKCGVSTEIAYDIIKRSSGFSKSMDWSVEAILNRNFNPRFSVELLHKDIQLALSLGREIDMPLDLVELGAKKVAEAKEKYAKEDICAIIKPLENKTNITVKRNL
ncbi:3-hydroxyisobutyrate dehydrogenase [Bacillus sp. TS-2]|nr:3-hydroxyisobutyrate dehydrogenase [Bacillus sp. TS-2]